MTGVRLDDRPALLRPFFPFPLFEGSPNYSPARRYTLTPSDSDSESRISDIAVPIDRDFGRGIAHLRRRCPLLNSNGTGTESTGMSPKPPLGRLIGVGDNQT